MPKFFKIQVFVPKTHADEVRLAVGAAGGGKLGNYDYCAFVSEGTGYFRPLEGSKPAIGEIGRIESVIEVKIEFICEESKVKDVLKVIKKVHPYEEVAFDVIPLVNFEEL